MGDGDETGTRAKQAGAAAEAEQVGAVLHAKQSKGAGAAGVGRQQQPPPSHSPTTTAPEES
uniref:Uncharacterized protein n=1 Tax=Oryza meridionalis TaxID=40149 RepID=A0A0E0EI57_9ORYZ